MLAPVFPDGRRALVVEDESLMLRLIEEMLLDLGFSQVETAMGVREALPLAETLDLDLAILDVNLGEQRSYPIADALRARGVPFLFATGYGSRGMDGAYAGSTLLNKPFRRREMEAEISRTLAAGAA